jgi:hypothetical protein
MDVIGVIVILTIGVISFVGGNILNYAMISDSSIIQAIEKQGFENVHITNKGTFFVNWHGCSGEHALYADFDAVNGAGKTVSMTACRGGIWPGSSGLSVRSK